MIEEETAQVRLPPRIYDDIERKVVALYKETFVACVPIDPFELARRKGFVLCGYSRLSRDARKELRTTERDAISLFDPEDGLFKIFYDDSYSSVRVRFSLMHEIGHIVLEHREESVLARMMANYFAGYALAPTPLIRRFGCDDFMEVADKFKISVESADIRFRQYMNWSMFSGPLKQHEIDLLEIFE